MVPNLKHVDECTNRHLCDVSKSGNCRAPDAKFSLWPLIWTCFHGDLEAQFRHVQRPDSATISLSLAVFCFNSKSDLD